MNVEWQTTGNGIKVMFYLYYDKGNFIAIHLVSKRNSQKSDCKILKQLKNNITTIKMIQWYGSL